MRKTFEGSVKYGCLYVTIKCVRAAGTNTCACSVFDFQDKDKYQTGAESFHAELTTYITFPDKTEENSDLRNRSLFVITGRVASRQHCAAFAGSPEHRRCFLLEWFRNIAYILPRPRDEFKPSQSKLRTDNTLSHRRFVPWNDD